MVYSVCVCVFVCMSCRTRGAKQDLLPSLEQALSLLSTVFSVLKVKTDTLLSIFKKQNTITIHYAKALTYAVHLPTWYGCGCRTRVPRR